MHKTDAVVIGAGPVGLFQVFQLGLQGLSCHVIDALPHPGGQCAELYGNKPIYDIPGTKVCTGQELADRLLDQIGPFAPEWHLGQQATVVEPQQDGSFRMETDHGTQLCARAVFIAAGVGAFLPRALKLPGLENLLPNQLHYRLEDGQSLSGLHVVVHGGSEQAVATALACAKAPASERAATITLQHRRDVFDAPDEILAELQVLRANGSVRVAIGVPTAALVVDGTLTGLDIASPSGDAVRVPCDALLVRLGLVARLGPIADWGLQLERKQLTVDPASFVSSVPGIYAAGDVITYPGKRKLILSGFHEATLAAFAAAEWLSGERVPLEYTTSSRRLHQLLGVPAS